MNYAKTSLIVALLAFASRPAFAKQERATTFAANNSVGALSAGEAERTLQGSWWVTNRVCSDGQRMNDLYVDGRDRTHVHVRGSLIRVSRLIDGTRSTEFFRAQYGENFADLNALGASLVQGGLNSNAQRTRVVPSGPDQILIVSDGYGPGGSCAVGTFGVVTFRRLVKSK